MAVINACREVGVPLSSIQELMLALETAGSQWRLICTSVPCWTRDAVNSRLTFQPSIAKSSRSGP